MWPMVVVQLVLAGALVAVGEWGRRHAPALVRAGQDREQRAVVLRRGALACEVVAVLFVLAAAAAALA
jgi:hypothetical protein